MGQRQAPLKPPTLGMAEAWAEEAELMLHGQPYVVCISVRGDELAISCELSSSGDRWKATFAAACARGGRAARARAPPA